jgi:hypothetical protein
MFKKCKVVMLPTNRKAVNGQLCLNNSYLPNLTQPLVIGYDSPHLTPQHLYILSDDEINDGDWIFVDYYHRTESYKDKGIWRFKKPSCPMPYWGNTRFAKKIIATTDPFLNLPSPSQSFIDKYVEEYNKGNKIEYVMVEYDLIRHTTPIGTCYEEQDFLKVNSKDNTITIRKIKDSWNRDEVITLLWNAFKQGESETRHKEFENWINNNL